MPPALRLSSLEAQSNPRQNLLASTLPEPKETHANTYLHAGSLAETVVNALLSPQRGRRGHGKAARIFRLATLGPAAEFPSPGWGSGHPSSPVSAAVAAEPFDDEDLRPWMPAGAALDGTYPTESRAAGRLTQPHQAVFVNC